MRVATMRVASAPGRSPEHYTAHGYRSRGAAVRLEGRHAKRHQITVKL